MKKSLLALAALLVLGSLAGCLSKGDGDEAAVQSVAARVSADQRPIEWSVGQQIDWWEDIATNYPKHDSNLPTNSALRGRLVSDLTELGLDVEVRAYAGQFQGVDLPDNPATPLYAIIATKSGTDLADHRIGLVSHYDTQTATINGAYDDASGVAADYSICKALAQVPLRRTLACIFFDGEERGLVASQRYVQDVVVEGDEPYVYDFVLGYDMTGINWPGHPWHLYTMVGTVWDQPADPQPEVSPMYPFVDELVHQRFGYPEQVEVLPDSHRNSDERRFKEAGVPIIRFAGGYNASDYDQYHKPLDTVDHVYEVTNGRANFEAGFGAIVELSYKTALALDRTTFDEVAANYG